jgi:hypothetical protein
MPEIEKKEPGHPAVTQRERGDPRQHDQPIDKQPDPVTPESSQGPPPERRRDDSPWMGGG